MHVDIIDNFDTLVRLRGNWDMVHAADPDAGVFLSWTWISGWYERLINQWIVLAVSISMDSPDYVGFLPLQLTTERTADGQFHNELRLGGGYLTSYNGFLCAPEFQGAVIGALAEAVKNLNWANFHLDNFFVSPERHDLFLSAFPPSTFSVNKTLRPNDGDDIDHDIYIYVPLPSDWATFLGERLGHKTRRNARNALKVTDDGSDYRITQVAPATFERDIEILLKLWETQWAAKIAARYDPGLPAGRLNSYRKMFTDCFKNGLLFLPILWRGDTPLGAVASLLDKRKRSLVCHLAGRDLTVKNPGPSFTLHMYGIRWAIHNGYTSYDFQTGDFDYKYRLGGLERRVECLLLSTKSNSNLRGMLEPRSAPVLLRWASDQLAAGRLDDAEQGSREILLADPENSRALDLLGQIERTKRQQPASIFVIVGHTEIPRLRDAVRAVYPRHFELPPGTWFVKHEDDSIADVMRKIGILDGILGVQAMVLSLDTWSGWGRTDLWDWIKEKQ